MYMTKYPTNIYKIISCDNQNINNTSLNQRTLLEIALNTHGSITATIIMMNPSAANYYSSDTTINRVIDFISNYPTNKSISNIIKNIGILNIVNLFSIFNPNSKNLHNSILTIISNNSEKYLKSIMDINLCNIKKSIDKSNVIILAWGDSPSEFNQVLYFQKVIEVLSYLSCFPNKTLLAFDIQSKGYLTKNGNPYHISRKSITDFKQVRIDSDLLILI